MFSSSMGCHRFAGGCAKLLFCLHATHSQVQGKENMCGTCGAAAAHLGRMYHYILYILGTSCRNAQRFVTQLGAFEAMFNIANIHGQYLTSRLSYPGL